jgi:8-oxo-dGTP pyrophosphatase MutT (NUDIX family)
MSVFFYIGSNTFTLTMTQLYIYVGNKPFIISNVLDRELAALAATHGTIMLNQPNINNIKVAINQLENTNAKAAIVYTNHCEQVLTQLKTILVFIQAGGGLVCNTNNEYLFITRRGMYDLPKGKLDAGETIEQCALREVQEETGLAAVTIANHLLDTWHVYHGFGQHVLKQTSWYAMECPTGQHLTPQTTEDITAINWLKKDEWQKMIANTYQSVRDVLNKAK